MLEVYCPDFELFVVVVKILSKDHDFKNIN